MWEMCYRNRYSKCWTFIHSTFAATLWHIDLFILISSKRRLVNEIFGYLKKLWFNLMSLEETLWLLMFKVPKKNPSYVFLVTLIKYFFFDIHAYYLWIWYFYSETRKQQESLCHTWKHCLLQTLWFYFEVLWETWHSEIKKKALQMHNNVLQAQIF